MTRTHYNTQLETSLYLFGINTNEHICNKSKAASWQSDRWEEISFVLCYTIHVPAKRVKPVQRVKTCCCVSVTQFKSKKRKKNVEKIINNWNHDYIQYLHFVNRHDAQNSHPVGQDRAGPAEKSLPCLWTFTKSKDMTSYFWLCRNLLLEL